MDKLSIERLNLHYGGFQALKNIDLSIAEGSITAFIGPSGCGKSTLLKSINRMNDLVENCRIRGRIALDGEDIYGSMDTNRLRRRVGMVFQKANPFPMSIYDNIAFGPAPTACAPKPGWTRRWKKPCGTPPSGTR